MPTLLSLCHSTVAELAPPAAIELAAATGCQHVSLRLMAEPPGGAVFPIMREPAVLRDTRERLRETGVSVLDVEVARLGPDTRAVDFRPFLEMAAEVNALHVLVTCDGPDEAALTGAYAAFCDEAGRFGLTADLEFVPWLSVGDLAAAARVVEAAARPNGGILVDTLHLDRSGGRPVELGALRPEWLHYVQISDAALAPATDQAAMIHTAREARLLPGDGGLDLAAMLRALPVRIPVALEIPMTELAKTMPARARVAAAVAATRRVLAAARWE